MKIIEISTSYLSKNGNYLLVTFKDQEKNCYRAIVPLVAQKGPIAVKDNAGAWGITRIPFYDDKEVVPAVDKKDEKAATADNEIYGEDEIPF